MNSRSLIKTNKHTHPRVCVYSGCQLAKGNDKNRKAAKEMVSLELYYSTFFFFSKKKNPCEKFPFVRLQGLAPARIMFPCKNNIRQLMTGERGEGNTQVTYGSNGFPGNLIKPLSSLFFSFFLSLAGLRKIAPGP